MSEMLHKLTGVSNILEVYEDKIIIKQIGALSKLAFGFRGDKAIYISDISSIQLKKPGIATNGFIQFTLPGGNEKTGGVWDSAGDENTVFFTSNKYDLVLKIKDTIERLRKEARQPQLNIQENSTADELRKFKSLADDGIISKEEFEQKKKELLGF